MMASRLFNAKAQRHKVELGLWQLFHVAAAVTPPWPPKKSTPSQTQLPGLSAVGGSANGEKFLYVNIVSAFFAPLRLCVNSLVSLLCCLAITGCTTPQANPNRPEEHLVTVQASQLWQPSGISANKGNIIHCVATGQWSDSFAKYRADGNPDTIKTHLGVSAPANGLLMRIGDQTNMVYFIGQETNVVAGSSGELKFRNNFSLSKGMHGELKVRVTVATDTDGDGIPDYEETHTWQTNPLRADSDGDGFNDLEEINDRRYRQTIP